MVWFPVFTPVMELVPVTSSVGVEDPDKTTPLTLVGVIAPNVIVMAGVVVAFATLPDTPFAVVTDTLVTVPLPPSTDALMTYGLALVPAPESVTFVPAWISPVISDAAPGDTHSVS
jgi:hypothetical protein